MMRVLALVFVGLLVVLALTRPVESSIPNYVDTPRPGAPLGGPGWIGLCWADTYDGEGSWWDCGGVWNIKYGQGLYPLVSALGAGKLRDRTA